MTGDYARNTGSREQVELKCPCCGWHRKIHPTGRKALQEGLEVERAYLPAQLGHLDPETEIFVRFRAAPGGKGSGFPTLRTLTLCEALADPAFQSFAHAVIVWARRIVQSLERFTP